MDKPKTHVTITTKGSDTSPSIHVAEVVVGTEGVAYPWEEAFGSAGELKAFLRGLKCMAAMLGRKDIEVPDVPKEMCG